MWARLKILLVIARHGGTASIRDLRSEVDVTYSSLRSYLTRLTHAGEIKRVRRGVYMLANPTWYNALNLLMDDKAKIYRKNV